MATHRDLEVYKLSVLLVRDVYKLTEAFPKSQMYGLASQMQRAAVSIPCNISEGASRKGTKAFIHFLYISSGSASELETQLEVSELLGYIAEKSSFEKLNSALGTVRMKLLALIRSLEAKTL